MIAQQLKDSDPFENASFVIQTTAREQEIIELLLTNKSTREIADLCSIAPETLHVKSSHIYDKFGVKNRLQFLITAIDNHKISLPEPKNYNPQGIKELTRSERVLAIAIASTGLSNRNIREYLGKPDLSERTINAQLHNIYRKLFKHDQDSKDNRLSREDFRLNLILIIRKHYPNYLNNH